VKKIHFLHIPKTAGQSVHDLLVESFKSVSPLRVNAQLEELGMSSLTEYDVISGHIDWTLMEKGGDAKFTFTVLRDPLDRILSFYHYLRKEAEKLDKESLASPQRTGMFNALNMSPDDYFCPTDKEFKKFIDDHYDNFYSYFFYSKEYSGNRKFSGKISKDELLSGAIKNLSTLNKIYTLSDLDTLPSDLHEIFPKSNFSKLKHVNKGDTLTAEQRLLKLHEIGASDKALRRIKEMCELDYYIFNLIK
jgi:hypothetical protein